VVAPLTCWAVRTSPFTRWGLGGPPGAGVFWSPRPLPLRPPMEGGPAPPKTRKNFGIFLKGSGNYPSRFPIRVFQKRKVPPPPDFPGACCPVVPIFGSQKRRVTQSETRPVVGKTHPRPLHGGFPPPPPSGFDPFPPLFFPPQRTFFPPLCPSWDFPSLLAKRNSPKSPCTATVPVFRESKNPPINRNERIRFVCVGRPQPRRPGRAICRTQSPFQQIGAPKSFWA